MTKLSRTQGDRNTLTTRLLPPSTSVLFPKTTNGKLSGSDGPAYTMDTMNEDDENIWKQTNCRRICYLNQELFPPVIKILERFHNIDIVHKNTTVSSSVERNSQALEPFLPSSIPNLYGFNRFTYMKHFYFYKKTHGKLLQRFELHSNRYCIFISNTQ